MMKVKPVKLGKTERMSFSHIDEVISMPNLIEVQKNSYQWFLDEGLKEVFHDIGTIEDYTGNLALSFVDFRLDKEPKYSIKECKERDVTYAAPLRVTARLLNKETGEVKDQEIFMGDFPLMTDAGTFVINGAERAIVSQLVRSPGVFYGHDHDKVGNDLYSATMNPNRGAWLEYETDASNVFYVRIDKNRKLPVTVLCRALGLSSNEDILNYFGEDERILATLEKDTTKNTEEGLLEVYRKLRPGEPPTVESATSQINMLFFDPRRYDLSRFGRYKMNKKLSLARRITGYIAAENVVAPLTGELLIEKDAKITRQLAEAADNAGVNIVVLNVEGKKVKVITKVNRTSFQSIIDSMDLGSVFNPRNSASNLICRYVRTMQNSGSSSQIETLYKLVGGKAEALEFRVSETSKLCGVPLQELKLRENLLIGCIGRGGQIIIPSGQDTIEPGDSVIVVTCSMGLGKLEDILARGPGHE